MSCCGNNTLNKVYSDELSPTYRRLAYANQNSRQWASEQTKEGFCGSCPRKNTTGMVVFIPGVF